MSNTKLTHILAFAIAVSIAGCGGASVQWNCACAATCDGQTGAVATAQICASQDEAQAAVDSSTQECVAAAGCAGATCACACEATATDC